MEDFCMSFLRIRWLFLAVFILPLYAQTTPPVPSIVVTGTGEVAVEADEATVRLGITREGKTADSVQREANQTAKAIVESIQSLGIDRKDIQTSQLSLYPVYSEGRPEPLQRRPAVVGYRASNVVSVRVIKIDQAGPVIDAGLKAGANQLEGVSFGLIDDTASRQQALQKAAADAKLKAQTLAVALGVTLGPILEATEGGVSQIRPMQAGPEMMMARAADASTPVSPGQIQVVAHLNVRYKIAP